jgi:hypothetical protein
MDALLSFLFALGALGVIIAIGAALQSTIGSNGMLADSSIRYHEREELGLGGFGRSIRSVTPKHR